MITKIYVHNYKCLNNFELSLKESNLLVGANGAGKSSVFEVLSSIKPL